MKNCLSKAQVYIAVNIPHESRIFSKSQNENIQMALLTALQSTLNQLEKRGYLDSNCSGNLSDHLKREYTYTKHKEKTKKAFVQETINVLNKYGWHGKSGVPAWAWSDFRKIPKEEYVDYLEVVQETLPSDSALYKQLKADFDLGLINSKQGVRYRYLCELIASITYVSASGYYRKEGEEE